MRIFEEIGNRFGNKKPKETQGEKPKETQPLFPVNWTRDSWRRAGDIVKRVRAELKEESKLPIKYPDANERLDKDIYEKVMLKYLTRRSRGEFDMTRQECDEMYERYRQMDFKQIEENLLDAKNEREEIKPEKDLTLDFEIELLEFLAKYKKPNILEGRGLNFDRLPDRNFPIGEMNMSFVSPTYINNGQGPVVGLSPKDKQALEADADEDKKSD